MKLMIENLIKICKSIIFTIYTLVNLSLFLLSLRIFIMVLVQTTTAIFPLLWRIDIVEESPSIGRERVRDGFGVYDSQVPSNKDIIKDIMNILQLVY